MRNFDVKLADLTIEGSFAPPAFALLRPETLRVLEQIYTSVERYGITLNDVTAPHSVSLAERNVFFNLWRYSAGIRLSVGKLEIGFNDLLRVTFSDVSAIGVSAFDALSKIEQRPRIATFTVNLNVHGIVEGVDPIDMMKEHVKKAPDGLGPSTGGAVGFYYGPEGPRRTLSIIMDGSALIPRGIFLRVTAGFDGQQIDYQNLPGAGRNTLARAFSALGLVQSVLDLGS